jgi:hypothetical protein
MATFDLLSSDFADASASPLTALANGGFACTVKVTTKDLEFQTMLVTFRRNSAGELVRGSEARLDTVFSSANFADQITLRETSNGNILAMHDANLASDDDFNHILRGLVVTPGGAAVGASYLLADKELTYQFLDGNFDFGVGNPSQAMLVSRFDTEKNDIFYDLFSYDSFAAKPTLTLEQSFGDLSNKEVYVFDDGSIYAATPDDVTFEMELLRANGGTPPDWKLPDAPQKVLAAGNRVVTTEISGPVLGQKAVIELYERGSAEPVATRTLSHAGEGAVSPQLQLAEIRGVGFAMLHDVETQNSSRYFVDIFDFDGDLIKAFKLDAAFSINDFGFQIMSIDNKDRIEVVVTASDGDADFGHANVLATTVKISPALDIDGTAQSDLLSGFALNDTLTGFEGDDNLSGRGGKDRLEGGDGDDFLATGAGSDVAHGGDGGDLILSPDGDDELFGDDGDDRIEAKEGDIFARGGAGDDQIVTGDGKDDIVGGLGKDTINAGKGNDTLDGGADADTLRGGSGNDTIFSGEGNDNLNGGAGKDIFVIRRGETGGIVIEDFQHGADKIKLTGFAGLNSFRKLEIFEVDEGRAVQLGTEDDDPLLTLSGVDSLRAADFIF